MPLKPGDHVDRYEIVDLIGEGGMGEVYRAHDTRLQRSVALKLLRPLPPSEESSTASGGAARILREARLAASLEHPNIVAIYDVGEIQDPPESRGTAYLAMELVRGRSLRTYVGDESIPIGERLRWLGDVARALGAAHEKGLVHRDVKPENVMVRDDGTVKVLDFGVAKRTFVAVGRNSSTEAHILSTLSAGGVVGTPYYMAPEQLRNEALDGRADQFAWGVMAYELLTGHGPWGIEGGGLQLVAEILSKTPPILGDVRSDLLPELSAAVMRALARTPSDRFASMHDLIDALATTPDAFAQTAAVIRVSDRDVIGGSPSSRDVSPHGPTVAAPPSRAAPRQTPPTASAPRAPRTKRRRNLVAIGVVVASIAAGGYGIRLATRRAALPAVSASASASTSVGPIGGCASNDECTRRLGAPSLCHRRDGVCAALGAPGCEVLASDGDVSNDSTIWIGTMFPLSGPLGPSYGVANAHAVDLARRDFVSAMGATASRPFSGARPIGVVSCDDADDPSRVARHLVDDVRVPAVIGFRSSTEAIDLAASIFLPRGVLTLAATNTSSLLATIPHPTGPRLVWRTTYNTLQTVPAITTFSERVLEPRVAALPGVSRGSIRVAVLRDDIDSCLAFAETLFRQLRFNGKSALDNAADFREVTSTDSVEGREDERAVRSLVDFAPHVVVMCGGDKLARSVIAPLERTWHSTRTPRPRYVAMSVLSPEFFRVIGKSEERRRRFFGVTTVSNTPANARFVMRYNDAFDDKITRTIAPNTAYDAFYLLAFASYALAANEEVTGATLASAMKRLLPPGRPVEIGPTSIYDAFNMLHAGGNVDVMGATGPLDFDPATGEAPVDMVVLCVTTDARGQANDTVESGLVYRAASGALEGTMRCP